MSARILALSEAQNHRCAYCGIAMSLIGQAEDSVSTDHFIPLSLGGHRGLDNEVAACCRCNNGRGNLDAHVYYYMVKKLGRVRAVAAAKVLRSKNDRRRIFASKPQAPIRAVIPPPAHEEARKRWLMAIHETELKRQHENVVARRGSLVRAQKRLVGHDYVPRQIAYAKPHGKPKDCNFDPALRKVACIKPPMKREPEVPLAKMSKRHRRQVKIAAQAQAPMMTA